MDKVLTGISGLDAMLEGGIPKGRIVLIKGRSGVGKTLLSIQYVLQGVQNGEPGIYVTLEEPSRMIYENMQLFGWDLKALEDEGSLKILDKSELSYFATRSSRRDAYALEGISRLIDDIRSEVTKIRATRLSIDPITTLVVNLPFPDQKRSEISRLFKALRILNCTALVSSEVWSTGDFFMEEYLADGALLFEKAVQDFQTIKTIRIEKMRGTAHDDNPRRYEITPKGLVVYDTEPVLP